MEKGEQVAVVQNEGVPKIPKNRRTRPPTMKKPKSAQSISTKRNKKDIHIGVELGAVVSSGPYENLKPHFNFSITYKDVIEFPGTQFEKDLGEVETAQKIAYERLFKQVEYVEKQAHQKAVEKFHKSIKWYTFEKTGERWPSVTSVIDFANPIDWFVSKEKLRGLAARGQVVDIVLQEFIKEYLKDGKSHWKTPEDIPECLRHITIMHDMDYEIEGNLPAFVDKFDVKFVSGHETVMNAKDKYGGQPDCCATFGNDSTIVLVDLKSFNPDEKGRIRTLKQTAAYAMACKVKPDKIGIMPIHGNNQQGYSKPVIESDIAKYYKMFMADRKVFFDTFGI